MFDPTMLMQFAEFEEEDGSPVAVCDPGCGKTFRFGVLWRIKLRGKPAELGIMRGVCWCAYCGTIVGEDECGRPYRIRLSRIVEALERSQAAISIMEDGLREDAMMSDVRSTQHATLRRMCEYASKRAAGEVA